MSMFDFRTEDGVMDDDLDGMDAISLETSCVVGSNRSVNRVPL